MSRRPGVGPRQFAQALGLAGWQFDRGLRDGLIPAADPGTGRWPDPVVAEALARAGQIRAGVGDQPDVGAWAAADVLTVAFGVEVTVDAVIELDRAGLLPRAGTYKGHVLYDGRALAAFTDTAAVHRAIREGRRLTRAQAAEVLGIRVCDLDHLTAAGWLAPAGWARSRYQARRAVPAVALFRAGDLDALRHHPGIDWAAVHATPPGRTSPLARLTTRSPRPSRKDQ